MLKTIATTMCFCIISPYEGQNLPPPPATRDAHAGTISGQSSRLHPAAHKCQQWLDSDCHCYPVEPKRPGCLRFSAIETNGDILLGRRLTAVPMVVVFVLGLHSIELLLLLGIENVFDLGVRVLVDLPHLAEPILLRQ